MVALPTVMEPPTLTVAVAVVIPAELALMAVVPDAIPVTGTAIEVVPPRMVADKGTVAMPTLLEPRVNMIPPAGAGAEIVRFRLPAGGDMGMERVLGLNAAVTLTLAIATSGAYPVAVAVICVEPMVPPVTCGFAVGTVRPAAMKTLDGTTEASVVGAAPPGFAAVAKLTVTPPVGAATPRLSGRLTVWPGAMVGSTPRLISEAVEVTDAVVLM